MEHILFRDRGKPREDHLDFLMRRQNDLWHRNVLLDSRLRKKEHEGDLRRLLQNRSTQMEVKKDRRKALEDLVLRNRSRAQLDLEAARELRSSQLREREQQVLRNMVMMDSLEEQLRRLDYARRSRVAT
eukprot:RCo006274